MNESTSIRNRSNSAAVSVLLVLVGAVNCSSTTQTNVTVSQGGNGGATAQSVGGTATTTDGGSTSTNVGGATAGGSSNANCAASAALFPDLHASCIEDIGQGKFRVTYDFTNADQGLDWSASTGTVVAVSQRALVVTMLDSIGVAIFKKKLHVDKASYTVTLLAGNTANWYINTIWSGSWNPDAGYGGYHDYTGRGFIINGTKYSPADVSPLTVGVSHAVSLEQSDTELKWQQDGTLMTEAVAPLPVSDRVFALGAWMSSAAFYDVVFEGTLN